MTGHNPPDEGDIVEIEPLTDDEAEAAFIAVITMFDKLGAAPAAYITEKQDEGVSIAMHFSATRLRELLRISPAMEGDAVTDAMREAGKAAWIKCVEAVPMEPEPYEIDAFGEVYRAMRAAQSMLPPSPKGMR